MKGMTPSAIEAEISRLRESPYVKLAAAEQRAKVDRRKQQLYSLRFQEKRGRELAALGVTRETVKDFVAASMADESEG